MDKIQSKYIKAVLGLRNQCRNTPILQALRVTTVSRSIQMSYLSLLRSCVLSKSNTGVFYCVMLESSRNKAISRTLMGRAFAFAQCNKIDLYKYIFSDHYQITTMRQSKLFIPDGASGIVDSVRYIMCNYNNENKKLLGQLLQSF